MNLEETLKEPSTCKLDRKMINYRSYGAQSY